MTEVADFITLEAVRIIFMGNVADTSPGILEHLARRSTDVDDPVSIAAVVCPAARGGRRDAVSFRIKRLIGRSLDNVAARRVPGPVKSAAEAQGGIHRELQRLAHRVRAPIWFPTSVNDAELCDRVRTDLA